MLPDFLSESKDALELAGRQLRILHNHDATQPLACGLTAHALDEAVQALAVVGADPWTGADAGYYGASQNMRRCCSVS